VTRFDDSTTMDTNNNNNYRRRINRPLTFVVPL